MPFPPKVPHIVGDESDEPDEEHSEVLPLKTERNIAENPIANHQSEYDSSESSGEDETNEEADESDSSSNDWSMEVSYIARTPERHRLIKPQGSVANANGTEMEVKDARNNAKSNGTTKKTSLMVDSPKSMETLAPPDIDMDTSSSALERSTGDSSEISDRQDQKGTLASDLQISSSNSDSEATIGEKTGSEKNKLPTSSTSSPIAIGKLLLPRTRVLSAADYSTPPTIAGRVAKRARRATIMNPPLRSELESMLAKPLDVTMYFQELSAKLVKSRVKLMAFLGLRNNIDSLVQQAMD